MTRFPQCVLLCAVVVHSSLAWAAQASQPSGGTGSGSASVSSLKTSTAPSSAPAPAIPPIQYEMMPAATPTPVQVSDEDGYYGQWYSLTPPGPLVGSRLSGGLAFYPPEHHPVAVHAAAVDKTFFVYAAASPSDPPAHTQRLRVAISYYDHKGGIVPRPVILMDARSEQAYGCPALTMDDKGRLYVFISHLGDDSPGQILRSSKPYDISAWEKVADMEFHHPQPWHVPGKGFMLVHTRMVNDQPRVFVSISPDGSAWSKPQSLATFGLAQSCISGQFREKIGVAITSCPEGMSPESRTDLYYQETSDLGRTWQVYPRQQIELPLADAKGAARACDYKGQWRVYLRNVAFGHTGMPAILHVLSHSNSNRPAKNSRLWAVSRWAIRAWETSATLYSDHSLDGGVLVIDRMKWYLVAPTIPGPQPNRAGGELVRWMSEDTGRSWYPLRLTIESAVNQNWPRHPLNAGPGMDFLWADGDIRKASPSRIYFADREGNTYVLPVNMSGKTARPQQMMKAATQPESPTAATAPTAAVPTAATVPAE